MHKPFARSSRRVVFESLEPRILLSADLIGADSPFDFPDDSPAALHFDLPENAAPDGFTLRLNAESGDLELLDGESVVLSQSLAETTGVVINGENGHDDWLTIDFAFGGVFSLPDGITFNGGAGGNDGLTVTGGSFTSVTHSFTETGPGRSGTMVYEGGSPAPVVIRYADLEPLDMTGSTITDLVFNLPGTNDQAILEDDGTAGNGISRIRSQTGAFETTTFSNSVTTLTINMGGDSGSFTVASLPDYSSALTVNGQAGSDTVAFTGTASVSTLSVEVGGAINANGTSNLQTSGNAHFSGSSITLGNLAAIANFGALNLNATGTAVVFEDSDMVLAGTSTATTFILTSMTGSITTESGASIRGMNSTMNAGTSIGTGSGALDIDLANLDASSGTAGSGGIFVNDLDFAANGLRIGQINADTGLGAIEITTAVGDIADRNGTGDNLFGSSVVLSAGRHIGSALDALEINTGVLTATSGTAVAAGDIYLTHLGAQALRLNMISADEGAGAINITSGLPAADLVDGNGAGGNLWGGTVSLASGRHIGFDGITVDALETEVVTLSARGAIGVGPGGVPVTAGDIYINELDGSLALGLIEAEAGNISIAAAGNITDANGGAVNLSGATVKLVAGGHIGFNGVAEDALETTATTIKGIDADGRVALKSAGALTIAGAVSAGANDVKLDAPTVTLAPAALLHVDLEGTAVGQFTRYLITGGVSQGGTLEATLAGVFAPAPLDRFRVMEFGSSAGSFATADLPTDFVLQEHAADIELVYSPDPIILIGDADVLEGNSGTTDAVFTVILEHGSVHEIRVNFATADGSASASSDYQTTSSTLVFAPGETSKMILVPVNGDTVFEAEETFTVELSGAIHGVIEDTAGTAAILNDDPLPRISIDDVTVTEGDAGAIDAQFTVSLTNASAFPIEVSFATADGTATAGDDDYHALTGTVTFDPGETSKQIVIAVKGDVVDELDETFFVQLSLPVNASIADGAGTGTIVDDDEANAAPAFVEIEPQTVQEGGELRFTVEATDADVPAQTLTFAAGALPAGAGFDPTTREFVWLPVDNTNATATFTVTDSEGASDVMEVVLTATNAAPTVDAGADQVVGLQRTDDKHDHHHKHGHGRPEADVSIAAAFDDLGAEDTHVASIDWGDGTVTGGTVSEPAGAADGSVTGEHTYKKAGTYTVKVTVTDDDGATRSDTLVVTVKKPMEKKNFDAREDRYKLDEDTVLTVEAPKGVLANDRTPTGATLEARLVEGPRHGELVLNTDGSFSYVPERDYHGKDSFWYEFTDGNNVSKAVEVTLQVKNVPEKNARPCIDWHDHWHAGWGHHDFLPFGHNAWKRLF